MKMLRDAADLQSVKPALSPVSPREEGAIVRKLARVLPLSERQYQILGDLQLQVRTVAAGTVLIREGEAASRIFIVRDGWGARYKLLGDGRRQILNFILPGDVFGMQASFLAHAGHSVSALTDMEVASFAPARLDETVREDPALGRALMWSAAREQAILSERLLSIGRRTAVERIGHLILELLARLRFVGLARGNAFALPLSQEVLADALGLSHVHVNRSLRKLRERGLIRREHGRIVIADIDRLTEQALFSETYLDQSEPRDLQAEWWRR